MHNNKPLKNRALLHPKYRQLDTVISDVLHILCYFNCLSHLLIELLLKSSTCQMVIINSNILFAVADIFALI